MSDYEQDDAVHNFAMRITGTRYPKPVDDRTNPLTKGSERLRNRIDSYAADLSEAEVERVANCIKADPGIKALVEACQKIADRYSDDSPTAQAAIKLWQHGHT